MQMRFSYQSILILWFWWVIKKSESGEDGTNLTEHAAGPKARKWDGEFPFRHQCDDCREGETMKKKLESFSRRSDFFEILCSMLMQSLSCFKT